MGTDETLERGWYRDANDPTQERYWNGEAWTTTRPLTVVASDSSQTSKGKEQWSLMPGETVVVESRPYVRDAIKWYLYLAIPTLGIGALIALFGWVYYKLMDFRWVLTDRRLVIAEGWLTRRSTTIALEKVQEVNRSQSFFQRHLYHQLALSIETAATAGTTQVAPLETTDPLPGALEAAVHRLQAEASL